MLAKPAFEHSPNDGADATRYAIGCDFGKSPPWMSYVYVQTGGVAPPEMPEQVRPEPKFKVGQMVELGGAIWMVLTVHEDQTYTIDRNGRWVSAKEVDLRPAPKFQVGEWVTKGPARDYVTCEIMATKWNPWSESWSYDVIGDGHKCHFDESDLTAQGPQHKHDCAGCVFLGRFEKWDLWFDGKVGLPKYLKGVLGADTYHASPAEVPSGHPDPAWFSVAHHRAVARGLVK